MTSARYRFSPSRVWSWAGFPVVVAGVLILVVGIFSLGLREREEKEAQARAEQASIAVIGNLESSIRSYAVRLESTAAFVGVESPTVDEFAQYFEKSGFGEDENEFSDVAVIEVVEGESGLADLLERERQDGNSTFDYLAVNESVERHYILTRQASDVDYSQVTGVDLALNIDIAEALESTLDQEGLTSVTFEPVSGRPSEAAVLEQFRASNDLVDSETLIVVPVEREEERTTQLIIGRTLTSRLVSQLAESGFGVNILIDDAPVRLSPSPSGSESKAPDAKREFTTGKISWVVSAESPPVAPDRSGSWALLIAGIAMSISVAGAVQGAKSSALSSGRLEQSELAARTDVLTSLPNRLGIQEKLSEALQAGDEGLVVFFLDLDLLKVINDSIGHSAGDRILCEVASRLQVVIRKPDVVGRFAGDKFVVFGTGFRDESAIKTMATKLVADISEPIDIGGGIKQTVSCSIGVAIASEYSNFESVLRDADTAMYDAKKLGGGGFRIVDEDLRRRAVNRLEVEQAVREQIVGRSLGVHYHPIVDAKTQTFVGVEALARLNDKVLGQVPPVEFIPVAEESGMIVELGALVLDKACAVRAEWSDIVSPDFKMAVNIAEGQLLGHGLVATVSETLARHGLEPWQLELEVSEDLLFERDDHRLQILQQLADLGVHLAIDDFGTGHAGLSQLKRLSMIKALKVDRSLITEILEEQVDGFIVNAVVALAADLGMSVVAEGVETGAQADRLFKLGVGYLQGFEYGFPAPAEKVRTALISQSTLQRK